MRSAALLLVASLLLLGGGLPAANAEPPPTTPAASRSQHPLIVVTFANAPTHPAARAGTTGSHYGGIGYTVAQIAHKQAMRVAQTYSLREVANWPIRALSVHCVVYEVPDDRPISAVLSALARDPQITLAQPLQQFHTLTQDSATTYNDPLYDLQTNLAALGIPRAHERSKGARVRVALIDTGVDAAHPDLHDRIAGERSFVDTLAGSSGGSRHGTAMAGLIAAAANNRVGIVGVAPLAQVEVFEACWQLKPNADEAACNTFTLAKALAAAIDARIPLVNLSIAGPADPLLSALIEAGLKRGAIFVGAASGATDSFPSDVPGVIGVGSSEHPIGNPTVTAPSVHVMTLRPQAQYDFVSGTSVAAAEVTGVVALLLSVDPKLTASSVQQLLLRTSCNGSEASPADALVMAGAVDASAALAGIPTTRSRRVAAH
jgi:subtilisin family serine protease